MGSLYPEETWSGSWTVTLVHVELLIGLKIVDSWNWKGEQPTLFIEDGRHSDCTSCHESDLRGEVNVCYV